MKRAVIITSGAINYIRYVSVRGQCSVQRRCVCIALSSAYETKQNKTPFQCNNVFGVMVTVWVLRSATVGKNQKKKPKQKRDLLVPLIDLFHLSCSSVLLPARRLDSQQHDAVFGALGPALEGGVLGSGVDGFCVLVDLLVLELEDDGGGGGD